MFTEFASYAVSVERIVRIGAILVYILFFRCIALGSLHPRVALFVNTISGIIVDMAHFMLTFSVLFVTLAVIGHVFMGQYRPEFSDIPVSLETQFMIITGGSFPFQAFGTKSSSVEVLYLLSYALIVFFFLTNFFLAIVVDGYAKVSQAVQDNDAENSIVLDIYDVIQGMIQQWKNRWPSPRLVLQYILHDQGFDSDVTNKTKTLSQCLKLDDKLPGVTAHELAQKASLMSLEKAELYLTYYMESQKNTPMTSESSPTVGHLAEPASPETGKPVVAHILPPAVDQQEIAQLKAKLSQQEDLLRQVLATVKSLEAQPQKQRRLSAPRDSDVY